MIQLPLLQSLNFYQTQTDWRTMLIMGGVAVVVIIFLSVFSRFSKTQRAKGQKRYSRRVFRNEASSIGLSISQTHLLEHYIKVQGIHRPYQLLTYSSLLISTVKKACHQLAQSKHSDAAKEKQKLELYRILQKTDASSRKSKSELSTRRLRSGQRVTLSLKKDQEIPSVVTTNIQDFFTVKLPKPHEGFEENALRKGRKILVTVYSQAEDKRVSFGTKVHGIAMIKGISSIMLKHTAQATSSELRTHRRRPLKCSCIYYPLNIVEQRSKRKASPTPTLSSGKGVNGTMIDLSPGGCSLESLKSHSINSLVKISFSLPDLGAVEVYGKVINLQTNIRKRVVFSIRFTRASARNSNRISEYCYDLG